MPIKHQGFTLIELMIVVAVVAILSSIAYPSYTEYVRRGHRAEARAGLLQAQQWLERAATATGTYPASSAFPANLKKVPGDRYEITLASPTGGVAADLGRTYTLLIRPCEVLSRVANVTILEVANNALRVLLQHRHVIIGSLA